MYSLGAQVLLLAGGEKGLIKQLARVLPFGGMPTCMRVGVDAGAGGMLRATTIVVF